MTQVNFKVVTYLIATITLFLAMFSHIEMYHWPMAAITGVMAVYSFTICRINVKKLPKDHNDNAK